MANFGGILDDLQGYANDVSSFFDTALGRSLAKGVAGGVEQRNPDQISFVGMENRANINTGKPITSEDPAAFEQMWLGRMRKFAGLDTGTQVSIKG